MFEEKLDISLTSEGYQRINSNAAGIYLYLRVQENELNAISVIHVVQGDEITKEQYSHILNQIRDNFERSYSQPLRLLNLVLTLNPNKVKSLCISDESSDHWIIDMANNRLMIYETQLGDFEGLSKKIEDLLDIEQKEKGQNASGYAYKEGTSYWQDNSYNSTPVGFRTIQFTLVNSVLIILNLIAYVITHYTTLFGSERVTYLNGALSWYRVINNQEYYRFLTSMFMHANLSHLFGNMLVLFFLGTNLERTIGKWKYILIYFGSGVLAGIASISYNMWQEYNADSVFQTTFGIGASGAIFGVVGALLFIILMHRGSHNGISALQVIIFTGINIYNGVIDSQIDQVAHVGGFIAGFLLAVILYRKTKQDNSRQSNARR